MLKYDKMRVGKVQGRNGQLFHLWSTHRIRKDQKMVACSAEYSTAVSPTVLQICWGTAWVWVQNYNSIKLR